MIIGIAVYMIVFLKSEQSQCVTNPMLYGLKTLDKINNAEISCTCSGNRPDITTVIITSEGIKPFQTDNYNALGSSQSPYNSEFWTNLSKYSKMKGG